MTRWALAALLPLGALAQDWGEGGDDFDFGETPAPAAVQATEEKPWSLDGFVRSDTHFWAERFDDGGDPWAKDRRSLDLAWRYKGQDWRAVLAGHVEHDLVYRRGGFDDATVETYETRYLDGEQFVAASFGPVDVTLGRQIVAWGEGDALSPLDVVNPRDLREPGLADLDDLRLAVAATRVGWFPGAHRFELMVVHEQRFDERPPPLGEFSPFRSIISTGAGQMLLGDKTLRFRDTPGRYGESQNVLLRWVYKGPAVDLGLYAASVLNRQGVVVLDPVALAPMLVGNDAVDEIDFVLDHPRYTMLGTSGATTYDSLLVKWELAVDLDRPLNTGDTSGGIPDVGSEDALLITPMVGLTWRGIADTTIALEWTQSFFPDEPDDLLFPIDEPQTALRVTHEAMRQRLQLSAAATAFGYTAELGWVARAEALYEVFDGIKAGVGYVTFQPPSDDDDASLLTGLDDHDRVFAKLRWDFSLN